MTSPTLHPDSGLHYVFVIPDTWGPFVDYWTSYQAVARKLGYITVISSAQFPKVHRELRSDPEIMFVCWEDIELPGERWKHDIFPGQPYDIDTPPDYVEPPRCYRTLVYFEAIGAPETLLPEHLVHWKRIATRAPLYDAIFVHTPDSKEPIRRGMSLPTYVFPAGWSPDAMGVPAWPRPQKHSVPVTWGSQVGRRHDLYPWLLSGHAHLLSGLFGRALLAQVETYAAALYVAHSRVDSFSTWRLWQMASTATALIAEPGDSWPFIAGIHYAPIAWIPDDEAGRGYALAQIRRYQDEPTALRAFAERAHELAQHFTIERCIEGFLIPASQQIKAARR